MPLELPCVTTLPTPLNTQAACILKMLSSSYLTLITLLPLKLTHSFPISTLILRTITPLESSYLTPPLRCRTGRLIIAKHPNAVVKIKQTDITMEDQVEALHAKAAEKFGGIDYAVNVAGYGPPPKKTATMSSEELALSYATNQRGVRKPLTLINGL